VHAAQGLKPPTKNAAEKPAPEKRRHAGDFADFGPPAFPGSAAVIRPEGAQIPKGQARFRRAFLLSGTGWIRSRLGEARSKSRLNA
jgi:hypothetical protein